MKSGTMSKMTELNKVIHKFLKKFNTVFTECPELRYLGDPVLRTRCDEVTLDEGLKIAEELKEVLLKYRELSGYGRGFSASQIGIAKRVFITYVNDEFKIYMNPVITKESKNTNFYRELCLSSGCLWADIERAESISIKYMNEDGKEITNNESGFVARLLQHEFDHLEGITNLDKAVDKSIEFVTRDPLKEPLRDHADS